MNKYITKIVSAFSCRVSDIFLIISALGQRLPLCGVHVVAFLCPKAFSYVKCIAYMHCTLVCVVFQHFHLVCRNFLTSLALIYTDEKQKFSMEIWNFCSWKTFLTQLWRFPEILMYPIGLTDPVCKSFTTRCIRKGAWNMSSNVYTKAEPFIKSFSVRISWSTERYWSCREACSCQENRCFVFLKRGW